jgi:hypothetical protein
MDDRKAWRGFRESLRKFKEQNAIKQRYNITVMEPHDVRTRINTTRNDSLVRVFEKHFLSYPEKTLAVNMFPSRSGLLGMMMIMQQSMISERPPG